MGSAGFRVRLLLLRAGAGARRGRRGAGLREVAFARDLDLRGAVTMGRTAGRGGTITTCTSCSNHAAGTAGRGLHSHPAIVMATMCNARAAARATDHRL